MPGIVQTVAKRLAGTFVSANFFSILRQHALIGRTFEPGEDSPGNDRVVILSYALWQSQFRGDPSIPGPQPTPWSACSDLRFASRGRAWSSPLAADEGPPH